MRARVVLKRVIEQYCDVVVEGVESLEHGSDQIEEKLAEPAARARLLSTVKWYDGEVTSPVAVEYVESIGG